MTFQEIYQKVFGSFETDNLDEIENNSHILKYAATLTGAEIDVLYKAFEKGPLDAGDLPSKAGAADLIRKGFLVQIISKAEDGFYACTYKGALAYKARKVICHEIL